MRRIALILGLAMVVMGPAAFADVVSPPSVDDPRIGVLHYSANQPASLQAPVGGVLTLLAPSGEHIQTVVLSDPDPWHVVVTGSADAVMMRASRPGVTTLMTVHTDARTYDITLSSAVGTDLPYLVRIETAARGPMIAPTQPPPAAESGAYKLSGDRALMPSSIRDDGSKMYIDWTPSQAVPAVFAIDELGHEETINGYMRGASFVIDRIYDQLLFRIDNAEATAHRIAPKRK